MPQYKQKPIVVEAFQINEGFPYTVENWPSWLVQAATGHANTSNTILMDSKGGLAINIIEGGKPFLVPIAQGDFIIQGPGGDLYVSKPDHFFTTHEEVVEVVECTDEDL